MPAGRAGRGPGFFAGDLGAAAQGEPGGYMHIRRHVGRHYGGRRGPAAGQERIARRTRAPHRRADGRRAGHDRHREGGNHPGPGADVLPPGGRGVRGGRTRLQVRAEGGAGRLQADAPRGRHRGVDGAAHPPGEEAGQPAAEHHPGAGVGQGRGRKGPRGGASVPGLLVRGRPDGALGSDVHHRP